MFCTLPLQSLGSTPQDSPTGWSEKQEYADRNLPDNAATAMASAEQENDSLSNDKQYLQLSKDDSSFVTYIKIGLSDPSLKKRLFFMLYLLSPFIILLIGSSFFVFKKFSNLRLICLNLAEIAYVIGHIGTHSSVYPWFCSPSIVGWIVSIIAFAGTLAVLYMHWVLVKDLIQELSDNLYCKPIWFYLLYSAIYIGLGTTLTLAEDWEYYLAFLVIVLLILLWKTRDDIGYALRIICTTGLYCIGFFCFFLNIVGFLIPIFFIGLLLYESGKSSKRSSNSNDSSDSDYGTLNHDINGDAYIRHDDGSRTDLREEGGSYVDSSGRYWGDTDKNDGNNMSC